MAGVPNKIGNSKNGKGKCLKYRQTGKRRRHQTNQIARRIKHYKIQPPLLLNGLPKDLAHAIRTKLAK